MLLIITTTKAAVVLLNVVHYNNNKGGFLSRHNALLTPLKLLFVGAKYEFDTTPAHLRFPTDDKLMLDFVARCPTDRTLSIGGDARVVAPMALSWLEKAQARPATVPTVDPTRTTPPS